MPILLRAEVKSGPYEFIAVRVVNLELFAVPDGPMVPVVDTVGVEVRLGEFSPVFARIRSRVSILEEPLGNSVLVGLVLSGAPGRVHSGHSPVDGMTEFVYRYALI